MKSGKSLKEALSLRFGRLKDYVWNYITSLKDMISFGLEMLKDLLSAIIEGIVGMFVGMFKQILRVVKEGVKIGMQAYSVIWGKDSKTKTPGEKGDAIVKILGGSAVALCGIGINALLEKVPALNEEGREILSTVLAGLASTFLFYALDKADLFNVKADKRKARISEVFEMRINEIREKSKAIDDAAMEAIRDSYIKSHDLLSQISISALNEDYAQLNVKLVEYRQFLFPNKSVKPYGWGRC